MRFDLITLFPELFSPFLEQGVTRRAFDGGAIDVRLWQLRDFASGSQRRVDDRPFGGGPGMVLLAEPLYQCLQAIRADRGDSREQSPLLMFAPSGQRLDHALVEQYSQGQGAVLLCGRYEGIDQRFVDLHVDRQISLGDFVISGGEIAAMALLDAVARLQPGVLNDPDSSRQDSFNPAVGGLLDHPHYTRPPVWRGLAVPAPLLSGNHSNIEQWRRQQSLALTQQLRPDLLNK